MFAFNICNEGFDSEADIKNHIKDKHESIMNDDSNSSDTDLYEGFDEEGYRIPQNNNLYNYEWFHGTVQPPPCKLVEGGTVCLYELTYYNKYV